MICEQYLKDDRKKDKVKESQEAEEIVC